MIFFMSNYHINQVYYSRRTWLNTVMKTEYRAALRTAVEYTHVPSSRILEKLTVAALVKTAVNFRGIPVYISILRRSLPWYLVQMNPIQTLYI